MKPPSSRARLWSSLLCLGSALAVSSRAQDDAVPPTEPPPGAAVDEEAAEVAEELREARQILADAAEDVPILAVHAKTLLDAGDLPALRSALTGSKPKAALGVLQALAATGDPDLLPELIAVAAVSPSTEVALLAMQTLERLADAREEIVALLVQRIAEGTLPSPQLETIVLVLGRSRDLAAVQRLIGELDGPRAVAANHALENLTGHQLGVDAGAEAWEDFWAEHSHMPRDVLLERALETERAPQNPKTPTA